MKRLLFIALSSLVLLLISCSSNPRTLFQRNKIPEPKPVAQKKTVTPKPEEVQKKLSTRRAPVKRPKPLVQDLPEGWTVDRHPVAKWGMSLPTVMSNVLDSAQSVEYWEEVIDLPTGYKVPLKRAKVYFQIITRLTIERVELHFMNINLSLIHI